MYTFFFWNTSIEQNIYLHDNLQMPIKHINLFSFKVTLTILDINSEKLLKCTEDGQAMQVLNDYLQGIYNDEAMALSTEPRTAEKVDS